MTKVVCGFTGDTYVTKESLTGGKGRRIQTSLDLNERGIGQEHANALLTDLLLRGKLILAHLPDDAVRITLTVEGRG